MFSTIGWKQIDENGFTCDTTKIYFCEVKDLILNQKIPGPRHICFQAKNHETVDLVARLDVIKNKILHGPDIIHPNGSYMLVFKDPDGYILEIAYKQ